MADPRIRAYLEAMASMAAGQLRVDVPTGDDELGMIGQRLLELGEAIEARLFHARKLGAVVEQLNRGLTLEEILNYIYEGFRGVIPYDRMGCALIEDDGAIARSVWARSEATHIELGIGYSARLEGSSLCRVIDTGEPRILNDLEAYLREHPASGSTRKIVNEGMRASLTCPLIANDRPVGFLFFSSQAAGTYTEGHVSAFLEIAGPVALGLERSRLHQEVVDTQRELELAIQRLERLARMDSLTGVANRRTFDEQLESEWRRATRTRSPLSLLMVDVDSFKTFNDSLGHQKGDEALRAVATVIEGVTRRVGDWVARYGGEEFAVLLASTDTAAATAVAERLRCGVEALAIEHPSSPTSSVVTVSVGVATADATARAGAAELVAAADAALYRAKDDGRNCVRVAVSLS